MFPLHPTPTTRLAVVFVAASLAVGGARAAPGSTPPSRQPLQALVVDDDLVECPSAGFTSIQDAVDAAQPGDTITVCSGTYAENVAVTETVRLLGPQHGIDARDRQVRQSGEAVLTGEISLEAQDVKVDGFLFRRAQVVGNRQAEDALVLRGGTSGHQVRNNVFLLDPADSGTTGILIASDGARTVAIERNYFEGLADGAQALGSSAEVEGPASNLRIKDNEMYAASMFFFESGSGSIIRGNVMDAGFGNAKFLSLVEVADVTVRDNRARTNGVGIRIRDVTDVAVRNNVLSGGSECIRAFSNDAPGFVLVRITRNRLSGCERGIVVFHARGVAVLDNKVEGSNDGIVLDGSTECSLLGNDVENNAQLGIAVSVDSTANHIRGNVSRGNGVVDCRDASAGQGTAGTANTWLENEGGTSAPPGLCVDVP